MKLIWKTLTNLETMISLVLNLSQMAFIYWGIENNKGLTIAVFGVLLIFGVVLTVKIIQAVKKDIEHTEIQEAAKLYLISDAFNLEYQKSNLSSFVSRERKSNFYFNRLSEKFPDLTIRQLKTLVETHLV